MRLLATRPADDAAALCAALAERGHETLVDPLLRIVFEASVPIPLDGVQALLVTSRNALRALEGRADVLSRARGLPLFAVGRATAQAARELGFAHVEAAAGNAAALAELVAGRLDATAGRLLFVRGAEIAGELAGDLRARGFAVDEAVVYRSEPARALADETQAALTAGRLDGVVLLSARTAGVLVDLGRGHGLLPALAAIPHFCLSAAVGQPLVEAGLGHVVRAAPSPSLEVLLALIDGRATAAVGLGRRPRG